MFHKIFIENEIKDHPRTKYILSNLKNRGEIKYIDDHQQIWGRVKKPYLQKRKKLNLFLASKKGSCVKLAPDAYGLGQEKHYYFIHAYNCIYECEYCYLQGYFNTPDLVFFVNHEEIIRQMQEIVNQDQNVWFHSGEFSDSLALSHITGELDLYFDFFKKNPDAKFELRTKSVNIKELKKLSPTDNIFVSFTLSSKAAGGAFDYKCPSVKLRLQAIRELVALGYKIGLHLDPIIYHDNFLDGYNELIKNLKEIIPSNQIGYISLGVVRFTPDVYHHVQSNYPDSLITKQDYIKSFDDKIRYNRPMRNWILNSVKQVLINHHFQSEKIYFCMED